jgi:hypothetical protein
MKVIVETHEVHGDLVPAERERFVVQRLCDVAYKVYEQFQRLGGIGGAQPPVTWLWLSDISAM